MIIRIASLQDHTQSTITSGAKVRRHQAAVASVSTVSAAPSSRGHQRKLLKKLECWKDHALTLTGRWSWAGAANSVKSYPNVVVTAAAKQISAIKSITSSWKWTYTGTDVVADVAYDLFTSSTASGDEEFEVMIWLAAIGGAGPISSTYVSCLFIPKARCSRR